MDKRVDLRARKDLLKIEGNLRLRKVTVDDCYDLWIWWNHPEVRKWSFDPAEIEYARHKEWFDRKIKDRDTTIYIAQNFRGEKIGQVRFEKKGGELVYISVNLNPEFFGKGFGNKIIKLSSEVYTKENPDIKEIIAEIIDINIVSRKAFQNAGYVFSHNGFKKGKRILIFKFNTFARSQEMQIE